MKSQMELLPEYMRFPWYIDEGGNKIKHTMNATSMKHPVTKNIITVKSKATSHEMALSLARGLTSPIQHFDEPEFTNHIDTIVSNSYSTFEQAAHNSKDNGGMYGRIFTCTPRSLGVNPSDRLMKNLSNCGELSLGNHYQPHYVGQRVIPEIW